MSDHLSPSNFQSLPARIRGLDLNQTSVLSRGALAKHLYEMRRLRENYFPADLFAEPAWDVLLLLYWAGDAQQRLSISAVCSSAGVPATTALRWIQKLVEMKMIRREAHP